MKRSKKIAIGLGVGALVLTVAVLAALAARPEHKGVWTDGGAIQASEDTAYIREVLWPQAEPVTGTGLGSTDEYEPRFSADGTLVIFVRNRPGQNADLYSARWSPEGWSEPAPLDAVNTSGDELGPELSRDGKTLYFYSDRPGGLGGYDLWVSQSRDGVWGPPANAGSAINSQWNEYGPALSPSCERLYFSSNRPRRGEPMTAGEAWSATIRERRTRHDYDLYVVSLSADHVSEAQPMDVVNTLSDEGAPALSPGGDFLYFASDRAGGLGGFDLYRVRLRQDGRLGSVENIGDGVNTLANELDPAVSSDGFRLTFSSDRERRKGSGDTSGISTIEPSISGRYSLWTSVSREVYRETTVDGPNAKAAWLKVSSWLVLLLALAPLFLLFKVLRDATWRQRFVKLGLLAQCLVISLCIHAAIASALTLWKVGSGIIQGMRDGGGTRVVLTSGAPSGALAGQLRGSITTQAAIIPRLDHVRIASPIGSVDSINMSPVLPELIVPHVEMSALQVAPPIERSSGVRVQPIVPKEATGITSEVPIVEGANRPTPEAQVQLLPRELRGTPVPLVGAAPKGSVEVPPPAASQSGSGPAPLFVVDNADVPTRRVAGSLATPRVPSAPIAEAVPNVPRAPETTPEPTPKALSGVDVVSMAAPRPLNQALSPRVDLALPPMGSASIGDHQVDGLPLMTSVGSSPKLDEAGNVFKQVERLGRSVPADEAGGTLARVPETARTEPSTAGEARRPGSEELLRSFGPLPLALDGAAHKSGVSVQIEPSQPSSIGPTAIADPGFLAKMPERALARNSSSSASHLGLRTAMPSTTQGPQIPVGIPVPLESFGQRAPEARNALVRKMGGSNETERAVGLALNWFMRHQSADGHWSAERFDDGCGHCKGAAEFKADAAMTGMVLLCYLGSGHMHTEEGPYREAVHKGLMWLVKRQTADGDLRNGETMYGQTAAAVALCEAFAMTRDPELAEPARKAVEFVLARAARPEVSNSRDTSVLGWLVFTVESARRAGFAVPQTTFESAKQWLEYVGERGAPGRYEYSKGSGASAAMTAEGMFVQQLLGHTRDEPMMQQSARFVLGTPPKWQEGAPTYYWYYATLALFQHQGEEWKQWNERLVHELLAHQEQQGEASGSWDPTDTWSRMGGRVYQTAVCTLSLEVYYRYKAR